METRTRFREARAFLRAGQRWSFDARLRRPHGSLNPHGFDFELTGRENVVLRALFRAAGAELLLPATPPKVVISEYVDVAKAFYDKRESGFVNGLLDAVAKDARS